MASGGNRTPELPQWRRDLGQALAAAGRAGRYAQLATAGSDGAPHNRTIVFRGFRPDCDVLVFVTDGRSAKVRQIDSNPVGALCWYFPQVREQFRIRGPLCLTGPGCESPELAGVRLTIWESLSPATREQFFWPPPGSDTSKDGQAPIPGDSRTPPACFVLLLLDPRRVDHLRLSVRPHKRRLYAPGPGGEWERRDVNP